MVCCCKLDNTINLCVFSQTIRYSTNYCYFYQINANIMNNIMNMCTKVSMFCIYLSEINLSKVFKFSKKSTDLTILHLILICH